MKQQHLVDGIALMHLFCEENGLTAPEVNVREKAGWHFGVCAYYRPTKIELCLASCAAIGHSGMAWSYPGYTVDRTPYGVLQHELGHHIDVVNSAQVWRYRGDFSVKLRRESGEAPISGYCPDDGEWFAEMVRVFITNPDLLRIIRPATYARLRAQYEPVVTASWDAVLAGAPERTRVACARKVQQAVSRQGHLFSDQAMYPCPALNSAAKRHV